MGGEQDTVAVFGVVCKRTWDHFYFGEFDCDGYSGSVEVYHHDSDIGHKSWSITIQYNGAECAYGSGTTLEDAELDAWRDLHVVVSDLSELLNRRVR